MRTIGQPVVSRVPAHSLSCPGLCWRVTGLLGTGAERKKDFFFGIISDGIHCHPATVRRIPVGCCATPPLQRTFCVRTRGPCMQSCAVCALICDSRRFLQVKLAYSAHPEGLILVTDAMPAMGLEPGTGLQQSVTFYPLYTAVSCGGAHTTRLLQATQLVKWK